MSDDVWVFGYAVPFGQRSSGPVETARSNGSRKVYERVAPDAFNEILTDLDQLRRTRSGPLPRYMDTDLALEHRDLFRLGASLRDGRLRLEADRRGLFFAARLDTSHRLVRETLKAMRRGEYRGCSMRFGHPTYGPVRTGADGRQEQTLTKVGRLRHIGVCTNPAYRGTSVEIATPEDAARLSRGERPEGYPADQVDNSALHAAARTALTKLRKLAG